MKKGVQFIGILVLVLGVGMYGIHLIEWVQEVTSSSAIEEGEIEEGEIENQEDKTNGITIIIDPGHGGEDPGKVGINNALEKDINLQIALLVYKELTEKEYTVIMTRDSDEGMNPEEEFSKVADLESRVALINEVNPDLTISIHQNSYTSESINGAQVFYYTHSEEGEKLAQSIQDSLLVVDEDNTREIKENDTYYLLNRTTVPIVIVECGFLSNAEEAAKLITEQYQQELSSAIVVGIEKYLEETQ